MPRPKAHRKPRRALNPRKTSRPAHAALNPTATSFATGPAFAVKASTTMLIVNPIAKPDSLPEKVITELIIVIAAIQKNQLAQLAVCLRNSSVDGAAVSGVMVLPSLEKPGRIVDATDCKTL